MLADVGGVSVGEAGLLFYNDKTDEEDTIGQYSLLIPKGWDTDKRCLMLEIPDDEDKFDEVVLFVNVGPPVGPESYGRCECISGDIFFAKFADDAEVGDYYGNTTTAGNLIKERPAIRLLYDTGEGGVGLFVAPPPYVYYADVSA